jgi:hypothetical protein
MDNENGFIPGRRKIPVNIQRLKQPIKKQRIENDNKNNVKNENLDENLSSNLQSLSSTITTTTSSIKPTHSIKDNLTLSDYIDLTSPVHSPIELIKSSSTSSSSSLSSDSSDSESNSPQSKKISSSNDKIFIPSSSINKRSNLKSIFNNENDEILNNVIPVVNLSSVAEMTKINTNNHRERSSSISSDNSFLPLRKRSGSDIQKEVKTIIKTKEDKESSEQWRQRLWPSKAQVNIIYYSGCIYFKS